MKIVCNCGNVLNLEEDKNYSYPEEDGVIEVSANKQSRITIFCPLCTEEVTIFG